MKLRAKLPNIQMFCLAYELGSFTKAAQMMGITPQAASRAVARLEADLGVMLFRRSTRQIQATDAGHEYYRGCRDALSALEVAESTLLTKVKEPVGVVRISVPTTYGHHRFMPMLVGFRRLYPRVEVEVEISNDSIDFVRDDFDLAIRMGYLKDASFVTRTLGHFSFGVFASPTYLKEYGVPHKPEDLSSHECGVFVMPRTGRDAPWFFSREPKTVLAKPAVRVYQDVLGLLAFAKAGGGLIQMFHFLVEDEVGAGNLQEVLAAYGGCSRPFSLIYSKDVTSRSAVKALIDYILEVSKSSVEQTTS